MTVEEAMSTLRLRGYHVHIHDGWMRVRIVREIILDLQIVAGEVDTGVVCHLMSEAEVS